MCYIENMFIVEIFLYIISIGLFVVYVHVDH